MGGFVRAILTALTNTLPGALNGVRPARPRRRRSASAFEYGLIVACVSIAVAMAISTVGGGLENVLNTVSYGL